VDLIILNWNGFDDTVACLKSVTENVVPGYRQIVVDNNSTADEYNKLLLWCKEHYDTVVEYSESQALEGGGLVTEGALNLIHVEKYIVLIRNQENYGFAGGNNVGIKYSITRGCGNVFLLNNDTIVQKNSLKTLLDFFRSNIKYDVVTPQIVYHQPNDIIWNCGGKINFFAKTKYINAMLPKIPASKQSVINIEFVTGCALMYRANKVGVLSEKFFFGEEDVELSLRCSKFGFNICCLTTAVIEHKVGGSIKPETRKRLGAVYLGYVSRLVNVKDYYKGFRLAVIRVYWAFHIFLNLLIVKRITLSRSFNFTRLVIKDSLKLEHVSIDIFQKYIGESFDEL